MPTPIHPARAYVAALTYERVNPELNEIAEKYGWAISATYVEDDAGQTLNRPELLRLLSEVQRDDVLLVDQIKRLGRLKTADWQTLLEVIREKRLRIVALDVPGSVPCHTRALSATTELMLEVLGAINAPQHADRLRKAKEGIDKAKADGKYKGRVPDAALHERIKLLLAEGVSIRKIATVCDCAKSTVQAVKAAQAVG